MFRGLEYSFKMIHLSLVTIVSLTAIDFVHQVWSTEMTSNKHTDSDKELLNHLEYCVLNSSAFRKKDGDGLWIIVNDTGEWLLVTNGSNYFLFSLNGSNCGRWCLHY